MSSEIQEHKVKLKQVLKGSKGELIILQDFDQTKESLVAMADKYKNLTVTKENFAEGKDARAEIREMRYGLQNISKHNNELINKAKSEMKDTMETLINILKPTEDKIHEQIKAIEDEKKLEKARNEKEEIERVAKINRTISDYKMKLEKLVSFGRTDDDVKEVCTLIDTMAEENGAEKFEEFGFEIDNLLEEYNGRLDTELRVRVQKIKDDAEQEKKNQILKQELDRRNQFQKLGLVENDGNYSYKGTVLHTSNIVHYTEKEFNEGLGYIELEIKRIDDAEAKVKAEAEAKRKAEQEAEAKKKAEEDAKLKAEREKFEKEKAEYEAKKKAEQDAKDKAIREQKEAEEKAKAELERKKKLDQEFSQLMEKCKGYGIVLADVNLEADKQDVINLLKQKIEVKEIELTEDKKKALKDAGAVHIEAVTPHHKNIFDYFGGCKIEPEHETAIVEFEDELRASFKKLKNSIS